MLIQCAKHIERNGGNPQNVTLHGQERNLGTWGICKMNMLLHGRPSVRIEKGDIRDPKLIEDGELILYDRVIANPPFSLERVRGSNWEKLESVVHTARPRAAVGAVAESS
jgi:type I restriction enzyme M protein